MVCFQGLQFVNSIRVSSFVMDKCKIKFKKIFLLYAYWILITTKVSCINADTVHSN